MMQADVIIIGAGAAGLLAARELTASRKKVIVLEARNRVGGRACTIMDQAFSQPVETGAEFVHGNLELTLALLKEAGLQTLPAEGAVWQSKDGRLFQQDDFIENAGELMKALAMQKEECSVNDFLDANFSSSRYGELKKSVQGYVEGYYAGDLKKASVLALKEEWLQEDEPQYRIEGGYTKLMEFLYGQCVAQGSSFHFSSPVKTITWAFEKVEVTTNNGALFSARKIISTIPVSVLQKTSGESSVQFQPQLTEQLSALQDLGSGAVIKILIAFKSPFWKETFNLKNMAFLFSDETVPTWWTQHPQQSALLVGWCAGPNAAALRTETDLQLFQKSMQSIAHIFNLPLAEVEPNIVAWKVCNWAADPFTLGGYSYVATTTAEALRVLSKPVADTIYFAGEGFYDGINTGTVEAALQSGRDVARAVNASFTV